MQLTFALPGRLETLTGGSIYDRRIIEGLRALAWSVEVRELDVSFPRPTAPALAEAASMLAALPDGSTVVIDGLAFGAMPEQAEREAARLRLVALVHHPLAGESGLDERTANALRAAEHRALATARLAIVTSRATAATLREYDVGPDRVCVVEPGTDRAPLARGSGGPQVHLLCVATLTPRKGHETLFRALAAVRWLDWRLTCVGSLDKDQATTARLRGLLHESRLDERVVLAGEMQPARLAAEFDVADVFVLPTLYEGYGMAVAEAIARGIPVVGTATGAIPDLVEASGYTTAPSGATLQSRGEAAGILVPPGDVAALADVLSAIISDGQLRARLASGARGRRERLPSWAAASSKMAEALQRVHR